MPREYKFRAEPFHGEGFEQNSDFPFNNIPGRVIEGEKE